MSFCPTKDIHSIYLDNEMPEIYKAEYESHVATCKKCQQELNKIKVLHTLLSSDADVVTPDSHYAEQSFERLQLKMRYSNSTKKSNNQNKFQIKYAVSAMAAAAIFALIIPVRFLNNNVQKTNAIATNISSAVPLANNVSFNGGRSRVISGNIHESIIPSAQKGNASLVRNVSNYPNSVEKQLIKDVDVFRPAFSEDKTISIRITIPGIGQVPVTAEVKLPVNVSSCYFE